jgi:hypothetical protein
VKKEQISILNLLLLFALCNLFLLCTTDYNPFNDYRNAQISIVDKTFDDTLEIFSKETLKIALSAPNLVESVIAKSPSNLEFNDGKQVIFHSDSFIETVPILLLQIL